MDAKSIRAYTEQGLSYLFYFCIEDGDRMVVEMCVHAAVLDSKTPHIL